MIVIVHLIRPTIMTNKYFEIWMFLGHPLRPNVVISPSVGLLIDAKDFSTPNYANEKQNKQRRFSTQAFRRDFRLLVCFFQIYLHIFLGRR